MPGQTRVPEGIRSHPSLCRRRASVPATRSRFLVSPVSPPVLPVSTPPPPTRTPPQRRSHASCPRGGAAARSTPLRTSARTRTVPIGAGSDGGSCTRPLRIIIAPRKPGTMPSFHHHLRGHCHGTNPLFLPARARCTGVVLPHALWAVVQRRRCPSPTDRAIPATPPPPL